MQVTKTDLAEIDTLIGALHKIRFDVSGTECMKLASTLAWVGEHRRKIQADVEKAEAEHQARIERGLALALAADKKDEAQVAAPAPADPAPVAATPPPRRTRKG